MIANGGAALDGLGDDASSGRAAEATNAFLRKSLRVVVVAVVVTSEGDDNSDASLLFVSRRVNFVSIIDGRPWFFIKRGRSMLAL
jgi:hypothetical protein